MRTTDLIARRFGVVTSANQNPLVSQVGTSSVQILSNNPNRLGITIVNLSSNNMYVGFDPAVSSSYGIFLTPNGGSVTLSMDQDYESTCWAMYAVAGAAASAIFVVEVLIAADYAG